MAAINGANSGLALVTGGLETDFPEADRNTNPGASNVRYGVTYKIEDVGYTGTLLASSSTDPDVGVVISGDVNLNQQTKGKLQ